MVVPQKLSPVKTALGCSDVKWPCPAVRKSDFERGRGSCVASSEAGVVVDDLSFVQILCTAHIAPELLGG